MVKIFLCLLFVVVTAQLVIAKSQLQLTKNVPDKKAALPDQSSRSSKHESPKQQVITTQVQRALDGISTLKAIYKDLFALHSQKLLDPNELFQSLSLFLEKILYEQTFEKETLEYVNEHLRKIEEWEIKLSQNMERKTEFVKTVYMPDVNQRLVSIKKLIVEKQKEYDKDLKEFDKVSKKFKADLLEFNAPIKQFTDLLNLILKTLQSSSEVDYWRTLEKIESQIQLGVFKKSKKASFKNQNFLDSIDSILSSRNFKQQKTQIVTLLSLLKSSLHDILSQYDSDQVKLELDFLDQKQFFETILSAENKTLQNLKQKKQAIEEELAHGSKSINGVMNQLLSCKQSIDLLSEEYQQIAQQIAQRKTNLMTSKLSFQELLKNLSFRR